MLLFVYGGLIFFFPLIYIDLLSLYENLNNLERAGLALLFEALLCPCCFPRQDFIFQIQSLPAVVFSACLVSCFAAFSVRSQAALLSPL